MLPMSNEFFDFIIKKRAIEWYTDESRTRVGDWRFYAKYQKLGAFDGNHA